MRRFRPERLTEAREVRELTMAVLGELVGKSPSSISHYENGHHTPSMDVVIRLSRALNAPVEFFFSDPRPRADGPHVLPINVGGYQEIPASGGHPYRLDVGHSEVH